MKCIILIGDIPIAVTRKRIKHVHLQVQPPNGQVNISAPRSVRLEVIEAFAASRLEGLRRQQARIREQVREAPTLSCSRGSRRIAVAWRVSRIPNAAE